MTLGFKEVQGKQYAFDVDFTSPADPLKNAIYMSLFCNKRDISPEFENKNIGENGWFGNLVIHENNFQQGSFLWTLQQATLNQENINLTYSYIEDCLQWLIDEEVVEDLEINFVDQNNKILEDTEIYSYMISINKILFEIKIKPFLKNEIKYGITIENGTI
ncbi:MAG: hypothetical protein RIR01_1252 [Bacteroidota bacterium]|jgi:phage gp46-like protein